MPKETFLNLKEERRSELLELAGECFLNMDYESIRVEDLVKTMKIPVGSFYRYFEDKDDAAVTYFRYKDSTYEVPMQIEHVMEPVKVTEAEIEEALPFTSAVKKLPDRIFERIIMDQKDHVIAEYKRFLTELKYDGKLRSDLDPDLISYMYATTLYNLELYYRDNNIENDKLRWQIKRYFYFTFFKYGIMGETPADEKEKTV
ncbi:MAG: TetR/AcrR family transcriptional regulator [Clostridiales bacterium]|nr:TetR/AcrR family transcriptional regulator [Clostridiales bacterium]